MESGERILMAAGLTAAVVVGAFVLWGPGGGPRTRKRKGQIAGLQNLGRTCFLNTLLQAMAACPQFIDWLKKNTNSTTNNSMITTLFTVIEVVNGSHAKARGGGPVCPLGVLRCLGALGWVVPEDQQDAHELLHVLLSCVEEETAASAKRRPGSLSDALALLNGGDSASIAPQLSTSLYVNTLDDGSSQNRSLPLSPRSLPPLQPLAPLRSVSSPATPDSPLVRCARSLSQTAIQLPDRNKNSETNGSMVLTNSPYNVPLTRGVSRSFCQLDRLGRPTPPPPPPPQAPFNGSLATRLQCTICSHKSPIRYDKFDSLSLHLNTNTGSLASPLSVSGLLRTFTAPELVKGVACSKCGKDKDSSVPPPLTTHIKSISIAKLPTCLCLHISRTQWGPTGLTKRSEHVSFQETLSLGPYTSTMPPKPNTDIASLLLCKTTPDTVDNSRKPSCSGDNEQWRGQYRLQAVVVHVGGPRSGHFVTYRRGNAFEANRWFYTSDTVVHEVSLDEVLHSSAYMLFYERMQVKPIKVSNVS